MADDLNALAEYSSDEETAVESTGDHAPKKEDTYSSHSAGFREFLLKPEILRAIVDCGFEHPSTVQNECIPQAIVGTDVICQAKSGMGKTAVFVLAVLQQLNPSATGVQCLVLAHTRELAYQIWKEFDRFKKYMPLVKTAVLYGGVPMQQHKEMLKAETPQILIATPGRVMALLRAGDLDLKSLKHFVVDECDKMLESLDMRADVQSIFTHTPHEKQVMMFSATLSDAVRPICKKFMHAPLEIYINEGSKLTLHGLKQYFVQLEEAKKSQKLVDLLDSLEFNQVVIFCSSVKRATLLNKIMLDCSFPSICIHGAMPQEDRINHYKQFKEFRARIMVATDLIGRGIDIERVNVVINYDMPDSADQYLHRVGRAGRFGTKGLAISFVATPEDAEVLNAVQSRFVVNIPVLPDTIDSSTYMTS